MIDEKVLNVVMWSEIFLLAFSVAVFFLHGLWLYLAGKRDARLTSAGRQCLVRLLSPEGTQSPLDTETLRNLPRDIQTTIFLEISKNLAGTGKDQLKRIARETAVFEHARVMCSSRRWTRRLRGARLLAQMDESDPLVKQLLRDRHPAVRAQATEWAAAQPTTAILDDLLDLLADPDTRSGFAVQDALLRIGREAVVPLVGYLGNHSGSAAAAGLRIASAMAEPAFIPAAVFHSHADLATVRVAAAQLLGSVGGVEAAERLAALVEDPDPDVRAAAAAALGRMSHWPAAPRLAGLLNDDHWAPRRAAALALRAIGGPGILLLRRSLTSPSQRVADIAQLALDMPLAGG